MEILPPLGSDGEDEGDFSATNPAGRDAGPGEWPPTLPAALEFEAVPRFGGKRRTIDAATQRAFIAALAATGSVAQAAKATGFAKNTYYHLRHAEAAESFSAAWDMAVSWGARRVLDTLMDHAINGAPETIALSSGATLERRRYDSHAMRWIVAHHFPESYAAGDGLGGHGGLSAGLKKLKAKWREEWDAERDAEEAAKPGRLPEPTEQEREDAERARAYAKDMPLRMLELYSAKCREERQRRRAGDFPAADFAMRQLTHIELALETLGHATETCEAAFFDRYEHGKLVRPEWSTGITQMLAQIRREAWEAETPALPRPPENLYEEGKPSCGYTSGPTMAAREKCRREAEREMAAGLVKWEACASEESWAAWRAKAE